MSRTRLMAGASALAAVLALASCATPAVTTSGCSGACSASCCFRPRLRRHRRSRSGRAAHRGDELRHSLHQVRAQERADAAGARGRQDAHRHLPLWYHVASEERAQGPLGLRPPVRAHDVQRVGALQRRLLQGDAEDRRDQPERLHLYRPHQLLSDRAEGGAGHDPVARVRPHGPPSAARSTRPSSTSSAASSRTRSARARTSPMASCNNHIIAATYPEEHPYGHSVIGSMDDLNAAKLDDVQRLVPHLVRPGERRAGAGRRHQAGRGEGEGREVFRRNPIRSAAFASQVLGAKRPETSARSCIDRVAAAAHLQGLERARARPSGRRTAGSCAAYALGGDKNARLTKRLVHDEQIATSVNVGNGQSEIAGQFRMVVTAKPDADLAHIEAVIDEEMQQAAARPGRRRPSSRRSRCRPSPSIVASRAQRARRRLLATWETYTGNAAGWKESIKRLEAATPATVRGGCAANG